MGCQNVVYETLSQLSSKPVFFTISVKHGSLRIGSKTGSHLRNSRFARFRVSNKAQANIINVTYSEGAGGRDPLNPQPIGTVTGSLLPHGRHLERHDLP